MTHFNFKNSFAQQVYCNFWILQWITMQVKPSLSVYLLVSFFMSRLISETPRSLMFYFSLSLTSLSFMKVGKLYFGGAECIESDLHLNLASWSSEFPACRAEAEDVSVDLDWSTPSVMCHCSGSIEGCEGANVNVWAVSCGSKCLPL